MAPAQRFLRTAALGLFMAAIVCPAAHDACASGNPVFPFTPGEKLRYNVYWLGIKAAEATLEILPMTSVDGVAAWHFSMTAHTTPLVAAIYPVHERMDAWAQADMSRSLRYTENKRKRSTLKHVSIFFDWTAQKAHGVKNEKRYLVDLRPGAFDPLSIFYFFRMQELHENLELTRPVADRKRCMIAVANVRGRQKVNIGDQDWDTWLVEPDLRRIEGVFKKDPGARLQIWVSADERRIPVMVKSKISVGAFTAELAPLQ